MSVAEDYGRAYHHMMGASAPALVKSGLNAPLFFAISDELYEEDSYGQVGEYPGSGYEPQQPIRQRPGIYNIPNPNLGTAQSQYTPLGRGQGRAPQQPGIYNIPNPNLGAAQSQYTPVGRGTQSGLQQQPGIYNIPNPNLGAAQSQYTPIGMGTQQLSPIKIPAVNMYPGWAIFAGSSGNLANAHVSANDTLKNFVDSKGQNCKPESMRRYIRDNIYDANDLQQTLDGLDDLLAHRKTLSNLKSPKLQEKYVFMYWLYEVYNEAKRANINLDWNKQNIITFITLEKTTNRRWEFQNFFMYCNADTEVNLPEYVNTPDLDPNLVNDAELRAFVTRTDLSGNLIYRRFANLGNLCEAISTETYDQNTGTFQPRPQGAELIFTPWELYRRLNLQVTIQGNQQTAREALDLVWKTPEGFVPAVPPNGQMPPIQVQPNAPEKEWFEPLSGRYWITLVQPSTNPDHRSDLNEFFRMQYEYWRDHLARACGVP